MAINIQETNAKSVLVKSRLPDTDYVINAYTGCAHGCQYCYANFMTRFSGHTEAWGEFTDVKINAPQVLKKDLAKTKAGNILMSSVTDPYNPLEKKYQLTRQILEILLDYQWPLSILTKSSLIVRDIDLLKDFKNCQIGFSFISTDDKVIRDFESHSSLASDRLKAIKQLKANNLDIYAFIAPILPYISDLEAIFQALAKAGVKRAYCDGFNYKTGNRQKAILDIVKDKYPEIWPKFEEAYKNPAYWRKLSQEIRTLGRQYKIELKMLF